MNVSGLLNLRFYWLILHIYCEVDLTSYMFYFVGTVFSCVCLLILMKTVSIVINIIVITIIIIIIFIIIIIIIIIT